MTLTKPFDAFGLKYRTTQFAAIPSLAMMAAPMPPPAALSKTSVFADGEWRLLDNREAINKYVKDHLEIIPPMLVLRGILDLVTDFSFGFAHEWKGVRIPSRFTGQGIDVKSSTHVPPMVAQIMNEKMATLRELEEYYSLEDAFTMFDVLVAKSVNVAVAHEAAARR